MARRENRWLATAWCPAAEECSLEPSPDWVKIEPETVEGRKFWNLTGTPTEAGEIKATVHTKSSSGEKKTESITITIRPGTGGGRGSPENRPARH